MPLKTYFGHTYERSECTCGGKYAHEIDGELTDCTTEAEAKGLIKTHRTWDEEQCINCTKHTHLRAICPGPFSPVMMRIDLEICPQHEKFVFRSHRR